MMIDDEVLEVMDIYGGSFVKQLVKLYRLADSLNRIKLEVAFETYFRQYAKIKKRENLRKIRNDEYHKQ